jgi:1-acyl-sn-glycerol-3-phosphate acyltransferase
LRAGRFEPDPLALHSPWRARLFFATLERRLARAVAAVRVAGDADALAAGLRGRPLVVYCNHPSWWDVALLAAVVARIAPGRRIFAPFDADALGRYGFLARCGAFGLDPASPRGARRLLEVGARVLADTQSVLCVTPQGRFVDARERPVRLQRGLAALLSRTPGAVALPVALEYPFWSESRPEALARLGEPVSGAGGDDAVPSTNVHTWQGRLSVALTDAMDGLAGDALSRDPARFRTLLDGRTGVGGVYDALRRTRAALAGRRFDVRHAAIAREPDATDVATARAVPPARPS